jgi:UDP-N-acetylmuramoylalanine--D-glutamate ligase
VAEVRPTELPPLAGRRVLVAGAGVTGRSVAAALAAMDARVTVTDANPDRLAELRPLGVELVACLEVPPEGTGMVVASPGWRPSAPLLRSAAASGVPVLGEVELAWRIGQRLEHPPAWLAVTGTNGKTTTVGMLEAILRAAGVPAVACGNVGLPVLDAVRGGYAALAVELSSFQLHWSSSLYPAAATVLNVAEDHIDWHGSMAEYATAKAKVYANPTGGVYNADDTWSARLGARHGVLASFTLAEPAPWQWGILHGRLVDRATDPDGMELVDTAQVRPAGQHNVANALAAAALARTHGVPAEAVRNGLRAFQPGAHRSVLIAEAAGVKYVDDSKATNPHAAAGSLRAYGSVVWIAGGLLKGASVDELVLGVADRLRGVVLLGTDAPVIAAALARHAPDVPVTMVFPGDDGVMIAAVRSASAMAVFGDVVLLAPAAASMDQFRDYAERGRAFADAVYALLSAGAR